MRKIFGICVALCLGFVWGCAEVEVLIPSHLSGPKEPQYDPGKPPITLTLDKLKEMQMQGGRPICDPKRSKTLEVPREKQQTPAWCWAASTRMVMEYHNKKQQNPTDLQCDLVRKVFDLSLVRANCCETKISSDFIDAPSECVRGGWPHQVLDYYQFSYQTVGGALDWEALTREICTTGPFIPVIDWRGGGSHAFIVTGYIPPGQPGQSSRRQIVKIYNPLEKDFEYLTFDEFVGDSQGEEPDGFYGFSHNLNFVQISSKAKDRP